MRCYFAPRLTRLSSRVAQQITVSYLAACSHPRALTLTLHTHRLTEDSPLVIDLECIVSADATFPQYSHRYLKRKHGNHCSEKVRHVISNSSSLTRLAEGPARTSFWSAVDMSTDGRSKAARGIYLYPKMYSEGCVKVKTLTRD